MWRCSDTSGPAPLGLGLQMSLWGSGFLKKYINLFIYLWLHWVFVAARGLSLVAVSGGYSSLRRTGFSLRWLLFVTEHRL